jgi:hypothetical protein
MTNRRLGIILIVLFLAACIIGMSIATAAADEPAQARPPECLTVPELPDECLSDDVYRLLTTRAGIIADQQDTIERNHDYASSLVSERNQLRVVVDTLIGDVQRANQALSIAWVDVAVARGQIERQAHRITVMRGIIRDLRMQVRT